MAHMLHGVRQQQITLAAGLVALSLLGGTPPSHKLCQQWAHAATKVLQNHAGSVKGVLQRGACANVWV